MSDFDLIGYDPNGAAEALGISRAWVYKLIGDGLLDARKMGRRTIITAVSVRGYLNALPPATIKKRGAPQG